MDASTNTKTDVKLIDHIKNNRILKISTLISNSVKKDWSTTTLMNGTIIKTKFRKAIKWLKNDRISVKGSHTRRG